MRRPRTALLGAFACLVGLVISGALSHLVPAGRSEDSASLDGFASVSGTGLDRVLNAIAHLADAGPYILLGAAMVTVALVRGRRRLALAVPVVMISASVTTEVLKHVTAQPRGVSSFLASNISTASWPSGHATAAMALALCAVLVSPARLRPLVAAVGALFAVGVAYAVIALVWHFPSDTIGGFLVAAAWALLAVAALRRWPDAHSAGQEVHHPAGSLAPVAAGIASLAVAGAVLLAATRPRAILERLAEHPSVVVSALAIALLAAVLAGALVHSARS